MKAKNRRQFTPEFKLKVVLEVLRQEKTINQVASDSNLHGTDHPGSYIGREPCRLIG